MEVSLNPKTTVKPQPITATRPNQYLPPVESGKYPGTAEINRSEQLKNINVHIPSKQLQSVNDMGLTFNELLVYAIETAYTTAMKGINTLRVLTRSVMSVQARPQLRSFR